MAPRHMREARRRACEQRERELRFVVLCVVGAVGAIAIVVAAFFALRSCASAPEPEPAPVPQTEPAPEPQAPVRAAQLSSADEALLARAQDVPKLDELLACADLSFDLLPRCIMAMRERGISAAEAVALVNADGDYISPDELSWSGFYGNAQTIDDTDSITVLVNKTHRFPDGYEPADLVSLPVGYYGVNPYMRAEAADAVVSFIDAAMAAGYSEFFAQSSYRSYNEQNDIYSSYAANDGEEAADHYSSRPGHSDHQTGLATDFGLGGGPINDFYTYDGYAWVLEHAHEYGLILRYPEGREFITGYEYENWHFRYVGVEAATIIWEHGWTLEEYRTLFS